jgi:hypothetical protein
VFLLLLPISWFYVRKSRKSGFLGAFLAEYNKTSNLSMPTREPEAFIHPPLPFSPPPFLPLRLPFLLGTSLYIQKKYIKFVQIKQHVELAVRQLSGKGILWR